MSEHDDRRGTSGGDRDRDTGDIAEEAQRLIGAVQQRVMRGVSGVAATAGRSALSAGTRDRDDVWSRATAEPNDASPIDRFVDFSKTAAPRVAGHLFQAGTALLAAARDVMDAYQETRPARPAPDAGGKTFTDAGSGGPRPAGSAPHPGATAAGGDPWASAADDVPRGGGPRRDGDDGVEHIDIG